MVRSLKRINLINVIRLLNRGKPLLKMSLDDYLSYEDENIIKKS
jgi:hypothetical protein